MSPVPKHGEMSEWLKEHAWKACIRSSRIGGSNPPLTAITKAALSCFFRLWAPYFSASFKASPVFLSNSMAYLFIAHPSFEQFMSGYPILCCLAQLVRAQTRKSLLMFMQSISFRLVTPFDAYLQLLGISNVVRLAFNLISCSYG